MGFFKGMSFPLASITVYNSVVFGFFSNTQRLISKYRYGDGRHPCGMLDLTVASMLTGLMSVSLGAPVDLVKIRLQMQTQTVLAGKSSLMFDLGFLFSLWAEERTRIYGLLLLFLNFFSGFLAHSQHSRSASLSHSAADGFIQSTFVF